MLTMCSVKRKKISITNLLAYKRNHRLENTVLNAGAKTAETRARPMPVSKSWRAAISRSQASWPILNFDKNLKCVFCETYPPQL